MKVSMKVSVPAIGKFAHLADAVHKQMPGMSTAAMDTNAVQLLTKRITKDLVVVRRFSDWQIAEFDGPQLTRQDSPLAGASFV